jgi:hypothetical protein
VLRRVAGGVEILLDKPQLKTTTLKIGRNLRLDKVLNN